MSETRAAWAGLLEVLAEAGERFAGEEWMPARSSADSFAAARDHMRSA